MNVIKVVWPDNILDKLRSFRSEYFTPEETFDFIVQVIMESENLLLNPVLGGTYVEEFGEYKGFSRIVIKKFRIYYKAHRKDIVVLAVMFPGEK